MHSSEKGLPRYLSDFDFIIKSGRAVLFPVYKGLLNVEADRSRSTGQTQQYISRQCHFLVKDLGRSIDYLESRPDINSNKLAYEGYSWGAAMGGLLPAVETRFKALILVAPGFYLQERLPEVDQVNFAPQ